MMYIKIKRKKDKYDTSFFQTFLYQGDLKVSVAYVLRELNSRATLLDKDGNNARRIIWECSCFEKKCGACAMLINGIPRLACAVFLKELKCKKNTIVLEPLSKFPVISDLKVDRNILFENMKRMRLWLEDNVSINFSDREYQYQSSRCVMCGCCLEVCPSFSVKGNFGGAVSMSAAFKLIDQSAYGKQRDELMKKYRKNFFEGCGKSLSCDKICPIGLPLQELLVKSNSAAIWHK